VKNPLFLAVLNFVTIGLGTLLLGRRPAAHGLLVLVGASLLRFEEVRISPSVTGALSIHWVVATLGLTLLGLATGREVYLEARAAAARR
jgi:uncharacterized membrane protein YczE